MNKNKRPDPEKYKEFIKAVELRNIKLMELSTRIVEKRPTSDDALKVSIKTTDEYKIFNDILIFYVNYTLAMKQSKEIILRIKAKYNITYKLLKKIEIDGEAIDFFGKINLPLNVWPFFRELCNDITAKMRIPPMVLPLLKG